MGEIAYKGYDNIIDLRLDEESSPENMTPVDLTAANKIAIHFLGNEYNSTNWPAAFDWVTDGANGVLHFKSNEITDIEVGHDSATEIIVFDPSNPNGIVWGTFDFMVIELEAEEVTP